jgi:heptosyltransferase-2
MHLAAAVGVPVVEISCHPQSGWLSHANSPARFAPWGVPNRIVQPARATPPCTDQCSAKEPHCICGVSVEDVQHAIITLLAQRSGGSRANACVPVAALASHNVLR